MASVMAADMSVQTVQACELWGEACKASYPGAAGLQLMAWAPLTGIHHQISILDLQVSVASMHAGCFSGQGRNTPVKVDVAYLQDKLAREWLEGLRDVPHLTGCSGLQ